MTDRPDPAQLAEAIKGLTDDQLETEINNLGADTVLTQIFEGMEDAFLPEKAQGVTSTIQYDIKTNGDTKSWTVEIMDGKCVTSEGPADNPRITLGIGLVDFVKLIFGHSQGPQLFMSGKLKLQGDMMFAMQMQTFFDRPA